MAVTPSLAADSSVLKRLSKAGLRRRAAIAPFILPAFAAPAAEHFRYDTSYQLYDEAAGRITVESWYYRGEMNVGDDTLFKFQVLSDAISGASPTGALPGGLQPFLGELEDVRTAILGALSHEFGDHRLEVEVSRSREDDYLSTGISLSDHWELNQKNTTLSMGFNYVSDSVKVFGLPDQPKKNYEAFFGASQLLDKNTILAANLTLGYSEGYLNDPYKAIQRTEIITVGGINIPVVKLYGENRPRERLRGVLQLQGTHFFEKSHSALDAILRLSDDSFGVFSQSLQIEWRQAVFSKFEITPYFRYYHQNAAGFFRNTLDGVPVANPAKPPDGSGPNYSADYRLSSLQSISLGIKGRYRVTENLALSAAYELYDMSGVGSHQSPAASYPTASICTFGMTFEF